MHRGIYTYHRRIMKVKPRQRGRIRIDRLRPSASRRRALAAACHSAAPLLTCSARQLKLYPPPDSVCRNAASHKPSVEEIYQRKSQVEHVLLRPDVYVGTTKHVHKKMWVADPSPDDAQRPFQIVERDVSVVPALCKIFDEILVNAADNYQRDKKTSQISVTIDADQGRIAIRNNGRGVPVQMHRGEKMHVPTLVFGHLLTGSNFNDGEQRVTGGRHGYGAKLANIFSTEFAVTTGDARRKRLFSQTWRSNMSDASAPSITPYDGENFTEVSFVPEWQRFHMERLEPDTLAVMRRRVYDVAACLPNVQVAMDGNILRVDSFLHYMEMMGFHEGVTFQPNAHWEIGVAPSKGNDHAHVSFVNGVSTPRGGTHVTHVVDQITRYITDRVAKVDKDLRATPAAVRSGFAVFVKGLVYDPAFDSQSKEALTTPVSEFGTSCDLSRANLRLIEEKTKVIDNVVDVLMARQRAELSRRTRRRSTAARPAIPKLDDANWAGTKRADECTLVLTEGDSAKAFAVAGLGVVGRDRWGVFPLRGKFLNVRDASHRQIVENSEFTNIKEILGLRHENSYESGISGLRYGRVMLMTDQDHDGSHIKGLILNMLHHFWPRLLERPGFVVTFVTPIVKATHARSGKIESFFSVSDYEKWKAALPAQDLARYRIKYYKGLGTSTAAEAREYFRDLDNHVVEIAASAPADGDLVDMAFRQHRSADRREWLTEHATSGAEEVPAAVRSGSINVGEFVNHELVHFSAAHNVRSIPALADGLKPAQRKVLFASFKRNLDRELKVAQLAGYVSEHAGYHHGEASLHATIVNMAQDYVGSNNLPLLEPIGQFGTRLSGGKDAASPRYIYTRLSPVARKLFRPEDDDILRYRNDDGFPIEPETYVPVIPLALVNGSEGVGTGWSTFVPPHCPFEIAARVRALLGDADELRDALSAHVDNGSLPPVSLVPVDRIDPLRPFFRGFHGSVAERDGKGLVTRGVFERVSRRTLRVSELPIGRWTDDYKAFLAENTQSKEPRLPITKFDDHHTEDRVDFTLHFGSGDTLDALLDSAEGPHKPLRLENSLRTTNVHLFDLTNVIKRYDDARDILAEFTVLRATSYEQRRRLLHAHAVARCRRLMNRLRFTEAVLKGDIVVSGAPRDTLEATLATSGFDAEAALVDAAEEALAAALPRRKRAGDALPGAAVTARPFDYLLRAPLLSLTAERIQQLQREVAAETATRDALASACPFTMWESDLRDLEDAIRARFPDTTWGIDR